MSAEQNNTRPLSTPPVSQKIFATLAGIFFAITLLKFGNPVILDSKVAPPEDAMQFIIQAWPVKWGYWLMLPVIIAGLFSAKWKTITPKWLLSLPLIWLAWQFISATQTVDAALTVATLKHFTVMVSLFYLGFFCLKDWANPWPLWTGLTLAFLIILYMGLDQHFGGLEETRKFFYEQDNWRSYPPEFLKKIASERIYSTLFYPNTLAGAILLLLPVAAAFVWRITARLQIPSRAFLVGVLILAAWACLFWSGSKAGWLIMLLLMVAILFHTPLSTLWKRRLFYLLLSLGLTTFGLKYAGFFAKGSTSVVARMDYWKAAGNTAMTHPIFGTGPGTFAIPYARLKKPESEMARLVHNDYLEQATDSGALGFASFLAFFAVVLTRLYRYSGRKWSEMPVLTLLAISAVLVHSVLEFHLYIPALGWPTFFLLGWLLRKIECNIDYNVKV